MLLSGISGHSASSIHVHIDIHTHWDTQTQPNTCIHTQALQTRAQKNMDAYTHMQKYNCFGLFGVCVLATSKVISGRTPDTYTNIHRHTYTDADTQIHTHLHVRVCIWVCASVCVSVSVEVCECTYISASVCRRILTMTTVTYFFVSEVIQYLTSLETVVLRPSNI